jgi:hypothetical protein
VNAAACLAVLLGLAVPAAPGAERGLPPPPVQSSEGFFAVAALEANLALRAPVLTFADTIRRGLEAAARPGLRPPARPVLILLGDATNDTRVIAVRAADAAGGPRERIELPDPEHADLDAFRAAIVGALLREWLHAAAARTGRTPAGVPDWLAAGLARHLVRERRAADFDAVYEQWSRGRLPAVADLLAFEPAAAARHPALQAVLAGWLAGRPDDGFRALLGRLADGSAWSAASVAAALRRDGSPAALDEEWDAWMAGGVRDVREPGATSPLSVRVFRSLLLLYPADHGIVVQDAWRGRTFAECLALPRSAERRAAAAAQALRIRVFAAGRDAALQDVAGAYARFLDALAADAKPAALQELLRAAEEARGQLETRAAGGATLRDTPRPAPAKKEPR